METELVGQALRLKGKFNSKEQSKSDFYRLHMRYFVGQITVKICIQNMKNAIYRLTHYIKS